MKIYCRKKEDIMQKVFEHAGDVVLGLIVLGALIVVITGITDSSVPELFNALVDAMQTKALDAIK